MKTTKTLFAFGHLDFYGYTFATYGDNINPYIRLSDVCKFLEHPDTNNPQLIDKLDDSEKLKAYQDDGHSPAPVWFVTIKGLWELVFRSRQPKAMGIKSGFIETATLITIEEVKHSIDINSLTSLINLADTI